jgi:hypothetical protein
MPAAQPAAWSDACSPLPPPSGTIIDVAPDQAGDLPGIVAAAETGATIQLAAGTYPLTAAIWFATSGVTMRSATGDRDSVTLDGGGTVGEPIAIAASDVTIADLTVTRAYWHNVHVAGGGADTDNVLLHNLHVVDAREQQVKVNPNNGYFTDYGELRCSLVEITDTGRPLIADGCYTGGIDAHQSRGWKVHHNVFSGIWCPVGLPDHAVHFWTGSRDTVVEANLFLNPARAIGFGLDADTWRIYPDDPCPGAARIGHIGGVIRNNFIVVNDDRVYQSQDGFDTGIGLEHACGSASVVHNSVASTQAPRSSSIEWRFPETNAVVKNNLTTSRQIGRDGGGADTAGNVENTSLDHFVSVAAGDLHLVPELAADAVKQGAPLPVGLCDTDYDGHLRTPPFDIGADEVAAFGLVPSDRLRPIQSGLVVSLRYWHDVTRPE